ncbi:MAG: hypothetical protein HFH68_06835 [Lachnospiraceae bacterium]|nr:hypothetical protein [Lachnospiraceae bacterium]
MKTQYTSKTSLICFLAGMLLSGCAVPGSSHTPSKGEIIISDALKDGNTITVTPAPKDINIVKLPEENGIIKENNDFEEIYSDGKTSSFPSGIVISGNAAYEQYTYIDSIAARYASITSKIADKLKDKADVYNIVIPTSIGITFPDNKKNASGSSDQKKSLEKIAGKMSGNVKFVPLYNEMMSHRKEYIYFRTDHHWTAKGAYYAYNAFCKVKHIMPVKLEDFKKVSFGSFTGSFYKDTNQNTALKKDTLYAYYPAGCHDGSISLKYTNKDGVQVKGSLIEDASGYGESLKYSAFIDGDNPYTIIENDSLKDNSSCIVIKESFGNALIPFLVNHYHKIYVIDYRYWDGNIIKLAEEKRAGDIIIVNNISMTRNSYQVGKMTLLAEGV